MLEPKKLNLLPEATTYNPEDLLYVLQDGISKQITRGILFNGFDDFSELAIPLDSSLILVNDSTSGSPITKRMTIGNLFNNIPENTLKVGANQLVITEGKIGIGIDSPEGVLDLYHNETRYTGENYFLKSKYELDPIISQTQASIYHASFFEVTQKVESTQLITSAAVMHLRLSDIRFDTSNSSAIGLSVVVNLTYPSYVVKAFGSLACNWSTNHSFVYSAQIDFYNQSYSTIYTASTPVGTALRIKAENVVYAGAIGDATVGSFHAIDVDINNTSGGPTFAIIDNSYGFDLAIRNGPNSRITNSYGILLNTPSNLSAPGAITNHYGLYIADQTIAGSTLNYALYVAGGGIYLGGLIGFFGHQPVMQPTKTGHNNWVNLSDVVQALVDVGIFDSV